MATASPSNNQFLQNQFMPQNAPYNGQNGMPQNPGLPGLPNPNVSSQGNDNGLSLTGALQGGATGLGNYLYGMNQNDILQNGQNISGASSLMNGINQQQALAQNGSEAAMAAVQPQNSTVPFEQMALARALADAGPSQNINPGGAVGRYTPSVPTNDNQWKAIQSAADQYFSPSAIENAQAQYNAQLVNVDPYAQPINFAGTYGDNAASKAAQDNMTNLQQQSQQRQANYNNNATAALQQALKNNSGSGIGSKIAGGLLGIGSGILGAL